MILVDAGPLVALVNADDQYHSRCVAALEAFREPMATVWPPLTEAMYLLADQPPAQEALWEMRWNVEPWSFWRWMSVTLHGCGS